MTILPQHIKEIFFKTIQGDIPLHDFELWLYASKELEALLNAEDYLALISIGYKQGGAKYQLYKLLMRYIDPGEFETYKMLKLLYEAKQKSDRLPNILVDFYNLYCKGYQFLQDLGLGFGLAIEVPSVRNQTADTWDELTIEQQEELLSSFSPELEECIEQAIYWLETKKIILTGEQDEIGHYKYEDLRAAAEEERKSKLRITVSECKETGLSTSKNTLSDKEVVKKWWEFWK